ncbi:MAG: RtcB family protein [Planctomycetaceae bacterium]|nr:RtcB family protein [Planctomycetaceae bacterium]
MNKKQLLQLGVPADCVTSAVAGIQAAAKDKKWRGHKAKKTISSILDAPEDYLENPYFADFARELIDDRDYVRPEPASYRTWGHDGIDEQSHQQMRQACELPSAVAGALMPDAHVGYGLPIGGVLALDNAVCPYAVGVDIACRMKLSVFDLPSESLDDREMFHVFRKALEEGTVFGTGCEHEKRQNHEVMDADWNVTRITRERKDRAWKQLGTSGSGNHFVEFGRLTLDEPELGLEAGEYVALMSHSGSRGAGHAVCSTYSGIAEQNLPKRFADLRRLAWLDLDSEAGQEYWAAMNLMGDYAAANHDVIHRLVSSLCGAEIVAGVENHHNFAWKETHGGKEVIVHRKGATPAGEGVLGVIPGSMASLAYVVRGKGEPESLCSASHGAGRLMSRKAARDKFRFKAVKNDLEAKGVHILSAGADEVPGVYKNIDDVMREQSDLVETIARFDPRIVKMCGDGSRPED